MELTLPDPVGIARRRIESSVRGLFGGDDASQTRPTGTGDAGLFGPGSAVWQVHGDLATLVGGVRALLLQTLHPLAMAGVAEHSNYRSDPFGRLQRTAGFVAATTFGTTEEAETAIAMVRKVHERVKGEAPDGRPYAATDPHLLTWVHVTEVDSFLRAHRRYGATPIDVHCADRYVAEMAEVARRLGAEAPPTTVAELRTSLYAYRPELEVGAQARDAIRWLLAPPLPLTARPPYALLTGAAIGLLPGWARRLLWLPRPPLLDRVAVRPATRATLGVLGWALGESPQARAAADRVSA